MPAFYHALRNTLVAPNLDVAMQVGIRLRTPVRSCR